MVRRARIRTERWLPVLLVVLGLVTLAQAQVINQNPIQLRGPPFNQRPNNQPIITVTDPVTGNTLNFGSIPQHVQLLPGKPTISALNNGSLGDWPLPNNNFVYAFPPEAQGPITGGGGGIGGIGGGLGGGLGGGGLGGIGGGLGGGGLGGIGGGLGGIGGGLGGIGGGLGGIGGGLGGIGGGIGGIGGGGLGGFGGGFGGVLGYRTLLPGQGAGFTGFGGNFAGFGGAVGAQGGY
jgi:hypothetical protein